MAGIVNWIGATPVARLHAIGGRVLAPSVGVPALAPPSGWAELWNADFAGATVEVVDRSPASGQDGAVVMAADGTTPLLVVSNVAFGDNASREPDVVGATPYPDIRQNVAISGGRLQLWATVGADRTAITPGGAVDVAAIEANAAASDPPIDLGAANTEVPQRWFRWGSACSTAFPTPPDDHTTVIRVTQPFGWIARTRARFASPNAPSVWSIGVSVDIGHPLGMRALFELDPAEIGGADDHGSAYGGDRATTRINPNWHIWVSTPAGEPWANQSSHNIGAVSAGSIGIAAAGQSFPFRFDVGADGDAIEVMTLCEGAAASTDANKRVRYYVRRLGQSSWTLFFDMSVEDFPDDTGPSFGNGSTWAIAYSTTQTPGTTAPDGLTRYHNWSWRQIASALWGADQQALVVQNRMQGQAVGSPIESSGTWLGSDFCDPADFPLLTEVDGMLAFVPAGDPRLP